MRHQESSQTETQRRRFTLGLIAGIGAGAAAMFAFDPQSGRRRRALARDKAVKARNSLEHAVNDELPKRIDYVSGFAHGARYRARVLLSGGSDRRPENEHVLVDRVLSTVFRDPELPKGEINVDADGTTVFLRGSIEDFETAKVIEQRVRAVEGVDHVINLINQPDADPSEVRAP